MNNPVSNSYNKIATIIEAMQGDLKKFDLLNVVEKTGLSSQEIQLIFKDWAGVGVRVEQFWEYMQVPHLKGILNKTQATLFDSLDHGAKLENPRIHSSFVEIIEMSAADFKNGETLAIEYRFYQSFFGEILIASTAVGICYIGFSDNQLVALSALEKRFPKATFVQKSNEMQQNVLLTFSADWRKIKKIKLHLTGTDFQIQVWKKLLQIPTADLSTYGNLSKLIQKPKAARAVGTAIGSNPIAFLIPCHRVIQGSGNLGGYMWGNTRKAALIAWEASH
ncbi:MAG: methylated-DNA--[protein]-cysteine S-methyltransferase [Crocinitomicaceae bacterium]|nr:methylated-DNA--[protein]-cysteine S-methyltransferase [Crocinitomicaceae bacterium]